ncbi:hypothetical protein FDP49_12395 [Enterococcus faecium]|uniref:McrC family protein n=1 Tax=Enterococcus faecium TaxID=1352 RepID=UPI00129CBD6A|nr:McrC family protein [Enterococcus faecium]MRJ05770.1 hypothetical protein [Enterococcus faecium]
MSNREKRLITVREFQPIFAEQYIDGVYISKKDIQELRNYIDEQNSKKLAGHTGINEFLKPIKNGVQVNNYVGIIQTNSDLTIEILPKIYGKNWKATDAHIIRELFLRMIRTIKRVDGKTFNMANLNSRKSNLLELFISMFLAESDQIIKRGLKSTYIAVQSNEKFLKGKLLMMQQLRKNSINQSNFYNEFDEFLINSPENQLIKTTLEFLLSQSRDNTNLRLIREQLQFFNLIDSTRYPERTYQKIQVGRNYNYYEQTIDWCRIFLSRKSFTSFKGSSLAIAILFPMENIFESYIAALVKKTLSNCQVSSQDKKYSLFDKTSETKAGYNLRPDLVVRRGNTKTTIADTKWKILDGNGPSQADVYQMYAYYTRYRQKNENVDRVILIYPYSENYPNSEYRSLTTEMQKLTARIQVKFVDLLSNSIESDIAELFLLS